MNRHRHMWKGCVFFAFEGALFIMPAFPDSLNTRLAILVVFVIGHVMGAQRAYLRLKRKALKGDTVAQT